jgi:hypothetical protein
MDKNFKCYFREKEEVMMPIYIMLTKLTDEGRETIKKAPPMGFRFCIKFKASFPPDSQLPEQL